MRRKEALTNHSQHSPYRHPTNKLKGPCLSSSPIVTISMAKITFIIEDLDNGSFQVKVTPPASEIAKIAVNEEDATKAHEIAIILLSTLRKYQLAHRKEQAESSIIDSPFL